jgi:hypothetical protein
MIGRSTVALPSSRITHRESNDAGYNRRKRRNLSQAVRVKRLRKERLPESNSYKERNLE